MSKNAEKLNKKERCSLINCLIYSRTLEDIFRFSFPALQLARTDLPTGYRATQKPTTLLETNIEGSSPEPRECLDLPRIRLFNSQISISVSSGLSGSPAKKAEKTDLKEKQDRNLCHFDLFFVFSAHKHQQLSIFLHLFQAKLRC
ncbi:hypothetical protein ACSAZL_06840 [Methanosarcina sp. T3]|uniref:hypothetical protein n=1 Tax=Methanosarcina sp. T3 TaxID=3439062 RepID=UPI003F87EE12